MRLSGLRPHELIVEYLDLLMFVLCAAILLGFPVVFTLAGVAVLFAGLGWLLGVFDLRCWARWASASSAS
jgi:TRAP-type mannitol/chloroaromatic compound transport system permease large subunit